MPKSARDDTGAEVGLEVFAPVLRGAADGGVGDVRVEIEEAGEDGLALGVNDSGAGRGFEVGADGHDAAVVNEEVSLADGGVDEGAAAYEDGLGGGGEAEEEERKFHFIQDGANEPARKV